MVKDHTINLHATKPTNNKYFFRFSPLNTQIMLYLCLCWFNAYTEIQMSIKMYLKNIIISMKSIKYKILLNIRQQCSSIKVFCRKGFLSLGYVQWLSV